MIRGILFDKDGTLVAFDETWMPAYRTVATELAGGDASLADRLLRLGGMDPATGALAPESLFAVGPISDIATAWRPLLPAGRTDDLETRVVAGLAAATLEHCRPVPGAARLLTRLAGWGFRLGVATNDGENGARAMLGKLGLAGPLDFVAGWDSGYDPKPAPGMVHGFCDATGLAPAAVMVVGDSIADMEMARRSGAGAAVAVLYGPCGERELRPRADRMIDDVTQLEELLP